MRGFSLRRSFSNLLFSSSPEVPKNIPTTKRTMLASINNAIDITLSKDSA